MDSLCHSLCQRGHSSVGEIIQNRKLSRVDFVPSLGINGFFAVFDACKIYPNG